MRGSSADDSVQMNLDEFERLAKRRRATRKFSSEPVPDALLNRLLDIAHWAPSGYNLQPTHYTVVTDTTLRPALYEACLKQRQILEAPVVVVFSGDREAASHHLEQVLTRDREAGAINDDYETLLRTYVGKAFGRGPVGLGWLGKASVAPLLRFVRPVPSIPAVHKQYWVTKQVMLSAMVFMLAATAAGLSTVPMEGFDEQRVRRVLRIPSSHIVPVVIPLGYATADTLTKTRVPLRELFHRDRWDG